MDFGKTIDEEMKMWMDKLGKSILPPDPLRVVSYVLRIVPTIEHITPLPPLFERIQSEFLEPAIEKLPRLPMTGDAPVQKWEEWIKE